MTKKILLFNILFAFLGIRISANVNNDSLIVTLNSSFLSGDKVIVGYYLGSRTFQKGVITLDENGSGNLSCDYHEGKFFLVFPDTTIYNFLVTGGNHYSFKISHSDNKYTVSLTANSIADAYAEYQKKNEEILQKINNLKKSSLKEKTAEQKSEMIKKMMLLRRAQDSLTNKYMDEYRNTLLGDMLKAAQPVSMPEFRVSKNTRNIDSVKWMEGIQYFRYHYLDNINWSDPRLIYTPVLTNKIDVFFDKIIDNDPDTLISAIQRILNRPTDTLFKKFVLGYLFRKYERTRNLPISEVAFVYLTKKYLQHPGWVSTADSNKLVRELHRIEPAMLGNIAPDITLPGKDLKQYSLHNVKAEHILLLFWEPGCGVCDEVIRELRLLLTKYNYLDLKVFTVATGQDLKKWDEYIGKKIPKSWTNVYETAKDQPSLLYNISYTPSMFLLDSHRKILSKYFTVSQLGNKLFQIAMSK